MLVVVRWLIAREHAVVSHVVHTALESGRIVLNLRFLDFLRTSQLVYYMPGRIGCRVH